MQNFSKFQKVILITAGTLVISSLVYVGILVFGFFFYVRGHGEAIGAYDEPVISELEECIFDQETQTDEFIKNITEFSNYTWNNSTKTAMILLQNGDSLYASRGGCNQFGISGKWVRKNNEHLLNETEYWLNQGIWISERLMPEIDSEEFKKMINTKSYQIESENERLFITFSGHNYSEWYLSVEKDNSSAELETGYYFD